MSYLLKKITLKNVSDMFSDMQLKRVIGGYDGTGPGSPCYSSTGSCHSSCGFIDNHVVYIGTCEVSGSWCICVAG